MNEGHPHEKGLLKGIKIRMKDTPMNAVLRAAVDPPPLPPKSGFTHDTVSICSFGLSCSGDFPVKW
jgi:hypothetical protein